MNTCTCKLDLSDAMHVLVAAGSTLVRVQSVAISMSQLLPKVQLG